MPFQVDRQIFCQALKELGHSPQTLAQQFISLKTACRIYGYHRADLLTAAEKQLIKLQWGKEEEYEVSMLEISYFHYCIQSELALFTNETL